MKKNSLTPKKCVKVEKVSELQGITVYIPRIGPHTVFGCSKKNTYPG
jgi:hypothetical protein